MGKKSTFKKIRKLAGVMPEIKINVLKGETKTGNELLEEGVSVVEGRFVAPNNIYKRKSVVQEPVNHNRRMKDLYKKKGMLGIQMYAGAVKKYIANKEQANNVA